ncbi:MAG TPA: hypothetical protein PKD26_03570 [Pyrinomonadaceae bacterium]|nr:hypothetical protein [Pyrinomonadaceae bacterium]
MKKVDYLSDSITRRSRQTEQLRVLSLSLMKAKKGHDEKLKNQEAEEAIVHKDWVRSSKEPTT